MTFGYNATNPLISSFTFALHNFPYVRIHHQGSIFQTEMSTETSEDVDNSISFSENVPEYPEEETERGMKSIITVCNGSNTIIYVELHPIEMVRRTASRNKKFGVGVDNGGLGVKVGAPLTLQLQHKLKKRWRWGRWIMRRRCWRPRSRRCSRTPSATSTSRISTCPRSTPRRLLSFIIASSLGTV